MSILLHYVYDHKKKDRNNNFPTRLVVPATNFTAAFPKIGYIGIKKIFDNGNVNYLRKTIIQASDLKESLVSLMITKKM